MGQIVDVLDQGMICGLGGCEQTTRDCHHISQESVQTNALMLLHSVFSYHGSPAGATQSVGGEATDKGVPL